MKVGSFLVLSLFLCASPAAADVRLGAPFGDHMVLQRDKPIAVWGTATPGRTLRIKAGGLEGSTRVGEDGRFLVMLPPTPADAQPRTLVVSEDGGDGLSLDDVLVGDVWICSGQSNMEMSVLRSAGGAQAASAADDPQLRLLRVQRAYDLTPRTGITGSWQACSPASVSHFSAVAYFFAREIRQTQQVPVGLIGAYWGGTPAEAWTPLQALEADPGLQELVQRFRQNQERSLANTREWEMANAAYLAVRNSPDPATTRAASAPRTPPLAQWRQPGQLFNGMIAPLTPISARGVLWYQGEANARRAEQYARLFPTLIKSWREAFAQPDLPFLYVQLANYGVPATRPTDPAPFAELRDAQLRTLKLPHTAMAVAIDNADADDPSDIHPKDKQTIGHRLALQARKQVYGEQDAPATGPTLAGMDIRDDRITLRFDHAGTGLRLTGLADRAFAVAGEDRKFVYAQNVRIDGDTVVLKGPLARPVAVRFLWADNPAAALYNGDGLPASPFRTDAWPHAGDGGARKN